MSPSKIPLRIPCPQQAYRMHPDLYDPSEVTFAVALVLAEAARHVRSLHQAVCWPVGESCRSVLREPMPTRGRRRTRRQ